MINIGTPQLWRFGLVIRLWDFFFSDFLEGRLFFSNPSPKKVPETWEIRLMVAITS